MELGLGLAKLTDTQVAIGVAGPVIVSGREYENGGDKLVHGSGGISQPRAE